MTQAVFKKNNIRLFVVAEGGGLAFKLSADRVLSLDFSPGDLESAKLAVKSAADTVKAAAKAVADGAELSKGKIQDLRRREEAAKLVLETAKEQLEGAELLAKLAQVAAKHLAPPAPSAEPTKQPQKPATAF